MELLELDQSVCEKLVEQDVILLDFIVSVENLLTIIPITDSQMNLSIKARMVEHSHNKLVTELNNNKASLNTTNLLNIKLDLLKVIHKLDTI